jgi:hypothetical protein
MDPIEHQFHPSPEDGDKSKIPQRFILSLSLFILE